MDEYLPPVVTKLKADLSDFVAGITEARAVMKAFANDVKSDMAEVSRSAGSHVAMPFVSELRKGIEAEAGSVGDDIGDMLGRGARGDNSSPAGKAGASVASMFIAGMKSMMMPGLVAVVIAAAPAIATAIAGAIQLGMGMGIIGLGAFMLRNEATLMAAATRFKDRVSAVFRTAAAPMLGPLITALDILGRAFERLAPLINKAFAALAPAIVPLANGIAGMMENLAPGLTAMLVQAGPVIAAFASELPGIGTAIGEFFQMIADNTPIILLFIHDMGRTFPAVLRVVTGFLGILIMVYGWITKLHAIMTKAGFETPFDSMETAGRAVWGWLSSVGPKIGHFFVGLGEDIANWATKAWGEISEAGIKIGAWFSELPGKVGNWLAALPGKAADAVQRTVDGMFYAIGFGLTRIAMLWLGFLVSIPGMVRAAWDFIVQYVKDGVARAIEVYTTWPGKTAEILASLWETVSGWMARTGIMIGVKAREMVDELIAYWRTAPARAGKVLSDLWNAMLAWAKTFREWGINLGKDIVNGLIDGWLSRINWAIDKVKGAFEKIKQGARDALDSHSPSKEFAKMGVDSMRGWVEGFLDSKNLIGNAMRVLVQPVGSGDGYAAGRQLASSGTSSAPAGGGRDDRPILIQLLAPAGEVLWEVLVPVAQQKKNRTGLTGLA